MLKPIPEERPWLESLLARLEAEQEVAMRPGTRGENQTTISSRQQLIRGLRWLLEKEEA